jgi:hypothetical protein
MIHILTINGYCVDFAILAGGAGIQQGSRIPITIGAKSQRPGIGPMTSAQALIHHEAAGDRPFAQRAGMEAPRRMADGAP